MTHHTNTYQHHVDPRYFNFLWREPMYITVEYLALHKDDVVNVTVQNLTAPPYLISAIVMHGGWQVLMAEIDISAKQNAEKAIEAKVSTELQHDYSAVMATNDVFKTLASYFEPK